jgi:CubicO group peptidase (beta-lactamase class C family)
MWWVLTHPIYAHLGIYFAWGAYGHLVFVVPEKDLVFVHRVNTFLNFQVDLIQALVLLDLIMNSQATDPQPDPILVPLATQDPSNPHARATGIRSRVRRE